MACSLQKLNALITNVLDHQQTDNCDEAQIPASGYPYFFTI